MKAGRLSGADAVPGVPYRPQANRIERDIEFMADRLKTQFLQSRLPQFCRPFVSGYCSDLDNLYGECTLTDADGNSCTASPFFHRFQRQPQVELSSLPHLGELISVVKPKAATSSEDRLRPRGMPFLLLGLWSAHACYDGSWVALCLITLLTEGKTHIFRTRDARRVPNADVSPKFPLQELADAYNASAAKSQQLHCPTTNSLRQSSPWGGPSQSPALHGMTLRRKSLDHLSSQKRKIKHPSSK